MTHPSPAPSTGERVIAFSCLLLAFAPRLFFSSDEYLAWPLFACMALACGFIGTVSGSQSQRTKHHLFAVFAALLVVHVSSFIGAINNGQTVFSAAKIMAGGIIQTVGFVTVTSVLLKPHWNRKVIGIFTATLAVLLVVSVVGYFIPLQRYLVLGGYGNYFEPTRLSLIWPTRLLTAGMGQLAWEHANHASFLFAIAFLLIIEFLASANRRRASAWWALAALLALAIFVTGSRNAMLMLVVCVPFTLIRRPLSFLLKISAIAIASVGLGILCVEAKQAIIRAQSASPTAMVVPPNDIHTSGLVQRGSMGRSAAYTALWQELKGTRTFGRGLATTGTPLPNLMHEHSIFLATFRGGGFVALAAHLFLIAISFAAAISLFGKGIRWPLLLLVAVIVNSAFDRSSVFRVSGSYIIPFFWSAIFIPILLKPLRPPSARDPEAPKVLPR